MKKTAILLTISLGAMLPVSAQWTSGGGITSTTDNVGIGVASPTKSLEVSGQSEFDSRMTFTGGDGIEANTTSTFSIDKDGTGHLYLQSENRVSLFSNSAELLRCESGGIRLLNMATSIGSYTQYGIQMMAAADQTVLGLKAYTGQTKDIMIINDASNSRLLTINENADLGLGIDPDAKLHLMANGDAMIIESDNSAPSVNQYSDLVFMDPSLATSDKRNWVVRSTTDAFGTNSLLFMSPNVTNNIMGVLGASNTDVKVGFGTSSPAANVELVTNSNSADAAFQITSTYGAYDRRLWVLPNSCGSCYNPIVQSGDMSIFFSDGQGASSKNGDLGLVIAPHSASTQGIRITPEGNVGIGTPLDDNLDEGYMLAVKGKIGAQEIKVETHSDAWSDFVFEADYHLKSLDEVRAFISDNGHLPDVPSAEEVEANGHNLGQMDAILLQKIEELTLYVLQLEEELKSLKP